MHKTNKHIGDYGGAAEYKEYWGIWQKDQTRLETLYDLIQARFSRESRGIV